jgi:hypothetical protein
LPSARTNARPRAISRSGSLTITTVTLGGAPADSIVTFSGAACWARAASSGRTSLGDVPAGNDALASSASQRAYASVAARVSPSAAATMPVSL